MVHHWILPRNGVLLDLGIALARHSEAQAPGHRVADQDLDLFWPDPDPALAYGSKITKLKIVNLYDPVSVFICWIRIRSEKDRIRNPAWQVGRRRQRAPSSGAP